MHCFFLSVIFKRYKGKPEGIDETARSKAGVKCKPFLKRSIGEDKQERASRKKRPIGKLEKNFIFFEKTLDKKN